jgi:hypothetical protein
MYGYPVAVPPRATIEGAVVRNLTQKTILSGYLDVRRLLFRQCYEERCPTTFRALLWRLFGRRGHPNTGWRPTLGEGLKSLRHGDPQQEGWREIS